MGLISNIGTWLDRKFPDRVVVTAHSYQTLLNRTSTFEKELAAQDTRIKNLCKELVDLRIDEVRTDLNKLKVAAGFKHMGPPQFPGINLPTQGIPPVTSAR